MRCRVLYTGLLLTGCLTQQHAKIPPTPHRWLTDTVKLLTPETAKAIDEQLEAYEKQTKHQVFVWIGDSTHGEPIGEWCLRAFNAWGIGRAGHDDGVVMFVFTKDDKRWITVGYGLESVITDREATRICREAIGPRMKAGHPNEAIADGVSILLADIDTWEKR